MLRFRLETDIKQSSLNILINCAIDGDNVNIVEYLISKGATVNIDHKFAITDIDIAKYITKNTDVNVNPLGYHACLIGNLPILKYIISINPAIKTIGSRWCISNACSEGHLDILKFIVSDGFNIGDIAWGFNRACIRGHFEIIKYMVETLNIDLTNNSTFVCHRLYMDSYYEILKYIIPKYKYILSGTSTQCIVHQSSLCDDLLFIKYLINIDCYKVIERICISMQSNVDLINYVKELDLDYTRIHNYYPHVKKIPHLLRTPIREHRIEIIKNKINILSKCLVGDIAKYY